MAKLELNSKFQLEDSTRTVEVGEILAELKDRFPNGFYSIDTTKYLRGLLSGSAYAGISNFCKELARSGFLDDSVEQPTNPEGHVKHRYRVKEDAIKGYFPAERSVSRQLDLPEGLMTLIETYTKLIGSSPLNQIQGALENTILNNMAFLNIMVTIKEESKKGYDQSGGKYLDRLIQQRQVARH